MKIITFIKKTALFILPLVFGLGIFSGYMFFTYTRGEEVFLEHHAPGYKWVSPLLSCDEMDLSRVQYGKINTLEANIETYIADQKKSGVISEVAVYMRDLKAGPWFGINEDQLFIPGSLLKVPLALSLYGHEENDPGFLDQQVKVKVDEPAVPQHFPAPDPIQSGGVYTIRDLVRHMLVYSDNQAAQLLANLLGENELDDVYAKLGIEIPSQSRDYSVKVKVYASFFRILYNATYVNPKYSEEILNFLTASSFTKGIKAGVGENIPVAHKFGERDLGNGTLQLHDCGIIYAPDHPYVLCIMTRGKDFDQLASVISQISKITYNAMAF